MKTTKTCGLLPLQPYHSLLILLHHHHHHRERAPWNWQPPFQLTSTTTTTTSTVLHICRSSRWDPNAESFRTRKFNYDFDDEEEDDNDLDDYIESIWIFKVFRSFGWALPFILVSLLLATGLKAFLMALALPLGLSTFSFAFQRMWGGKEKRPKRQTKTKSRSRARSSRSVKWGKDKRVGTQWNKKAKLRYQSWDPGEHRFDNSTDLVNNAPTFGGWDEPDSGSEFVDTGSSSSSSQRVAKSQKSPSKNSRLSTRIGKTDTPLLLRLLVAVFPFLGSWTKML
ncbi:hypothetical protein ACH5RR_032830 [Cinchona calisaya]|uniref:Uncharacterized protein n=1 Tax=Cinchona calisaya TaxID=153742 RepID=A0ABD2YJ83_9GENT